MSGPYNGHLLEFPQIRVDCFTSPPAPPKPPWLLPHPSDPSRPPRPAPPAQLFLLTHVHTDHLMGLTNDFTGHIICSPDTKRMLPQLEAEVERARMVEGVREVKRKKYDRLRPRVVDRGTKDERVVDIVEAIPYGVPKRFELGYEDGKPLVVIVTLLEANHCPGSSMFLIASDTRAVLHTGDVRADSLFLQTLRRNPALGEFIAPWSRTDIKGEEKGPRRTLDRIYLDTGAVLGTGDMPDREVILRDLIDQMSLYPDNTTFFLNVWCFGWEDVVKEVARHFDQPIHVDRYKRETYDAIQSDPFLSSCTTLDAHSTRFHACDRFAKCGRCRKFNNKGERVYNTDKLVVDVVMVEIKQASWDIDTRAFLDKLGQAALGEGEWPYQIQCPIARHSPLPELQALVKMFRPNALSPNTIAAELRGIDYYAFPDLFQDCLSPEGYAKTKNERDSWFRSQKRYGEPFLRTMEGMRVMRIDLAGGMGSEVKIEAGMLEAISGSGNKVGAVGRSRRAHTFEQLARAGATSHISAADSEAILAALQDNTARSSPFAPFAPSATQIASLGKLGGMASILDRSTSTTHPVRRGDEYDTDEERHEMRKRRKTTRVDPKTITNGPMTCLESVKGELSPAVHLNPVQQEDGDVVKVERPSTPDPTSRRESSTPRPSLGRRSFFVDKDHLRALAMVSADVDDL